jgi:hypothetical protein
MAFIDDPRAWILHMFKLEQRSSPRECQRYDAGALLEGLPLEDGELVYGVFKDAYFFTPRSLVWRVADGFEKVRWTDVESCSSRHGEGEEWADLALTDGTTKRVRVGDLAVGWSGRISQLFHQLIERHGSRARLGPPLYSIEEFFAAASDDSCAPNLEPHPTLDETRHAVEALARTHEVTAVFFKVVEIEGGQPTADGLVVCGPSSPNLLEDFSRNLGADGVGEATEETIRKLPPHLQGQRVWEIVWD